MHLSSPIAFSILTFCASASAFHTNLDEDYDLQIRDYEAPGALLARTFLDGDTVELSRRKVQQLARPPSPGTRLPSSSGSSGKTKMTGDEESRPKPGKLSTGLGNQQQFVLAGSSAHGNGYITPKPRPDSDGKIQKPPSASSQSGKIFSGPGGKPIVPPGSFAFGNGFITPKIRPDADGKIQKPPPASSQSGKIFSGSGGKPLVPPGSFAFGNGYITPKTRPDADGKPQKPSLPSLSGADLSAFYKKRPELLAKLNTPPPGYRGHAAEEE